MFSKFNSFKSIILIGIFYFLFHIPCSGQQLIKGRVLAEDNQPLKGASIRISNFETDKMVKLIVTDSLGIFLCNDLLPDKYYLHIRFVGYPELKSGVFNIAKKEANLNLGDFSMNSNNQLKEVVIASSANGKISQSEGVLTVNVANSVSSAGLSGIEVIERLPGVTINRENGGISLKGKDGTMIMINGRRTYMTNDALLQFLSSITASRISKIEVISNPSSSMDAEGNSGLINVIIKKNSNEGLNGSVEAQAGFGRGTVGAFNGDLTFSRKNLSIYLNYGFARLAQEQISFNDRSNLSGQSFSIRTNSARNPVQRNHNIKYGMEYQFSKDVTIGGNLTYYDNLWTMDAENSINIGPANLYNSQRSTIGEINHWKHLGGNLNFQSTVGKHGVFTANFDYLYYKDNNPSDYLNSDIDQNGKIISTTVSNSTKLTPIHIAVPQINYKIYSNSTFDIKIGVKGSISDFDNKAALNTLVSGNIYRQEIIDNSRLDERIFAGFVESAYKIDSVFSLKGGLRYEHTSFKLNRNDLSLNMNRRYGNFFPNLVFSARIAQKNQLSLYYNRRINRPTFNDIAPFILYLDPYTIFTGNAAVQPSVANNFGLDINVGKLLISSGASFEETALAKFQISVDPVTNRQIIRPENLGKKTVQYLGVILPVKLSKIWEFQNSVNASFQQIRTGLSETARKIELLNFQYTATSTLRIKPGLAVELAGFYNTKSMNGTSIIKPFGGLNFGVQKKIGSFSTLRLNVNDILNSIKSTAIVDITGYNIRNGYDFSQRTFKFSYTYSFGQFSKNISKATKTAEEEKKRVE